VRLSQRVVARHVRLDVEDGRSVDHVQARQTQHAARDGLQLGEAEGERVGAVRSAR
jgi:hypothetical protein